MVGIGPFIPHHDTPFAAQKAGTLELTLFLLGLIRLMLPKVLLPATTALGTIAPNGRELGILSGANVVMPNLSPNRYEAIICSMTIRSVPMQKQPNAGQSWSSVCSPSAIR